MNYASTTIRNRQHPYSSRTRHYKRLIPFEKSKHLIDGTCRQRACADIFNSTSRGKVATQLPTYGRTFGTLNEISCRNISL